MLNPKTKMLLPRKPGFSHAQKEIIRHISKPSQSIDLSEVDFKSVNMNLYARSRPEAINKLTSLFFKVSLFQVRIGKFKKKFIFRKSTENSNTFIQVSGKGIRIKDPKLRDNIQNI